MRPQDIIVAKNRLAARGLAVSWSDAEALLVAILYLHRQGYRPPKTIEEAKKLEGSALAAARAYCAIFSKYATGCLAAHHQQILECLRSKAATDCGWRRSPEPFRSFTSIQPRGVFSLAEWREKAGR